MATHTAPEGLGHHRQMPKIPDSTKASLHQRLIERAHDRWPQVREIRVRYRAGFAYIDGVLTDGEVLQLCRLRYGGSARDWGFAIYRASHDDYEDSFLPTGFMGGSSCCGQWGVSRTAAMSIPCQWETVVARASSEWNTHRSRQRSALQPNIPAETTLNKDVQGCDRGVAVMAFTETPSSIEAATPDPFAPARLGPVWLRNRIIKSATSEGRSPKGLVTDDLIAFHRRFANGGVGMTTVAYCCVAREGASAPGQILMGADALPGLQKLTDAVHDAGATISAQLGHAGVVASRSSPEKLRWRPAGSSILRRSNTAVR